MKEIVVEFRLEQEDAERALQWTMDYEAMQDAGWEHEYPAEARLIRLMRAAMLSSLAFQSMEVAVSAHRRLKK